MATQLNIKDPVLIERVRDLARREGKPVTATLRGLVDRAWESVEDEQRQAEQRLHELLEEVRRNMPAETRAMSSVEICDSIYDDNEPDGFAQ